MTALEIAKQAVSRLNKRITNEIFMTIQNDTELMQQYLRAIETEGLDKVNQTIGKEVKRAYQLSNVDDRENNPRCTLIQSHQKFE